MKALVLERVSINGDDIWAAKTPEGRVKVSVRRVCASLGLDQTTQADKLKEAPWATVGMIPTVGKDGKIRNIFCIDAECIPMWMSNINTNKVSPPARPILEKFQKQAAAVLHRWATGQAVLPVGVNPASQVDVTDQKQLTVLALALVQQVQVQQVQLEEQRPKVEVYEQIVASDELFVTRDVGKQLKCGGDHLRDALLAKGWIHRNGKRELVPNMRYVNSGFLELKSTLSRDGKTVRQQLYITGRGLAYLAQLAPEWRREGALPPLPAPRKRGIRVPPTQLALKLN